jgi:hypothetical protein
VIAELDAAVDRTGPRVVALLAVVAVLLAGILAVTIVNARADAVRHCELTTTSAVARAWCSE